LILAGIERSIEESAGPKRLSLDPPLIAPANRRLELTDEQIYELIEFP
jgi:hypothetical protein